MYLLFLSVFLAIGGHLFVSGVTRHQVRRRQLGLAIIAIDLGFFALMSFWGEWLWFQNLGYESRFWTLILARISAVLLGMLVAGGLGFLLAYKAGYQLRALVAFAGVLLGALWALPQTEPLLMFWYGLSTDVHDPMLGINTGFYLFRLPFFTNVFWLLLSVAAISLVAALFVWESGGLIRFRHFDEAQGHPWVLPMANAGLAWMLMFGMVLCILHLLYSDWGVVRGPGWVDVHVHYPAFILAAVGFFLVGLLPLFEGFRRFMTRLLGHWVQLGRPAVAAMAFVWASLGAISVVVLLVIPGLVQWLVVKPNEITFEKPYIAHNIEFTRKAFKLDKIEAQAFVPATSLTRETIANNRNLLSEIRLWDWRALDAVYRQFQEIRLYYEFVDVDIDRYQIGDRYRQLMVSARELGQHNLTPQSRTFVNERFKYTHGYGYTAAAVSDFTPEGLPHLLVQDIPPVSRVPELAVHRPEIYYGELTTEAVIVNTEEAEFDYPSGDKNIYTRYQGIGGVQLSNFWRKLVFGWKLDETMLLFSGYPTPESRVMLDREVIRRVEKIAPFITFDEDPYIVAHEGRLVWIIDGFTLSAYYPYAQSFDAFGENLPAVVSMHGKNYLRNSVKAVVDAYDGTVHLYVFENEDPIIRTWQKAFPGLFKPRTDMPENLQKHVRYPVDLLLVQGLVYATYHMSDPEVFYNQEDLWVRATEKHYNNIINVEPYYVMWELPGSDQAEFVLILPFTPKNKQVLIGWIAGLSDGENYGRFLAYNFPKETRMLGPQQVETKIDQDPFLSGQLTLWDQQGSEVIRGNVLAIPVDNSLIYVEPIYLRAETAAYPELRLVAIMHGDQLSYAETFEAALAGLFYAPEAVPGSTGPASIESLASRANQAFKAYLQAQGEADFQKAAIQLEILKDTLEQLATRSGEAQPE